MTSRTAAAHGAPLGIEGGASCFATRPDQWARHHMNSAAARLDAQLREIHASWRDDLLELEDVDNLTRLALDTYVTAAHHPLVGAGGS